MTVWGNKVFKSQNEEGRKEGRERGWERGKQGGKEGEKEGTKKEAKPLKALPSRVFRRYNFKANPFNFK